jgi:hypothetical protein
MANTKILLATVSALDNPTANGVAAKATVVNQVMIVYYQAALRYAYLLDDDIAAQAATSDHQGEGGAFWRVIAPSMHNVDAVTTAYVSSFYDMTNVPTGTNHYCPLALMLHANMPGNHSASEMGVLQGSSVTLPQCAAAISASTVGAKKTDLIIQAPGVVGDYDAGAIGAETAKGLGISPSNVQVTITSSSRRRKLQTSSSVAITISVYSASDTAATAMETQLTSLAGTAATASTFLTAATGRTVTVTNNPQAPRSMAADEESGATSSSSGLSTGAMIAIIVGAVVAVIVCALIAFMMMKKNKSGVKIVSAT